MSRKSFWVGILAFVIAAMVITIATSKPTEEETHDARRRYWVCVRAAVGYAKGPIPEKLIPPAFWRDPIQFHETCMEAYKGN